MWAWPFETYVGIAKKLVVRHSNGKKMAVSILKGLVRMSLVALERSYIISRNVVSDMAKVQPIALSALDLGMALHLVISKMAAIIGAFVSHDTLVFSPVSWHRPNPAYLNATSEQFRVGHVYQTHVGHERDSYGILIATIICLHPVVAGAAVQAFVLGKRVTVDVPASSNKQARGLIWLRVSDELSVCESGVIGPLVTTTAAPPGMHISFSELLLVVAIAH
jgi:hypothetical protein